MVLTICVVMLAVSSISFISIFFIRSNAHNSSDQLLLLLCETGERNLENYFDGVQKSVAKMSNYAESDLEGLDDESLSRHMKNVSEHFDVIASKTNGVLTYYYRIDPAVSKKVKGFWYTNLDGNGFVEHKVTDITLYDTEDKSKLVWFTVPKHEGKAIWTPPYITDNLDVRVISYNVPIYFKGQFIGVVGIEIDFSTMAEQVDNIRLYSNGYAYLNDAEGNLFYHPRIDISKTDDESMPKTPAGVVSESTFFRYTFEGVKKEGVWLPLSNGMRLNVVAPVSETDGSWMHLLTNILLVTFIVLAAASIFTMIYTRKIAKPLKQLTEAAEKVDKGNYDYKLTYDKDDEVGRLTKTFQRLVDDMRKHIGDLNHRVFIDSLTKIKNKAAFTNVCNEIQSHIDNDESVAPFAIGILDCNDLKYVNDVIGHEKGDEYLKNASKTICDVFQHSPVFRIGGDEFAVLLRNYDYQNRNVLVRQFKNIATEVNTSAKHKWERIDVAIGIADYDPSDDRFVSDVVRRADRMMYENKQMLKNENKSSKK